LRRIFFILLCLTLCSTASVSHVAAWGNGGYSQYPPPFTPKYGTHDWIAEHALDWLPDEEKQFITDHLLDYRYGTELPDNKTIHDGIGDTAKHIVYYSSTGNLMKNSSAGRASDLYTQALNNLTSGDFATGAENAGAMSHYIADLAAFGHVMGSMTDWGKERHHSDYEDYVGRRTSNYDSEFDSYLIFDGELAVISAYDAALKVAYDTTFDIDGDLTCVWMDQNYDWRNPVFKSRCGESLNLAVNIIADVLHTLWLEAGKPIPELNLNAITALVFILITATVIVSRRSRRPSRLHGVSVP